MALNNAVIIYNVELSEQELTMICNLLNEKNKKINDDDYKHLERKLTELYYSK